MEEQRLPVSLGIASSKLVAKIACDFGKPQGLVIVPPGEERGFLAPLPIERLWGVGQVTGSRLRALGIQTIGDLAAWDEEKLVQLFGEGGHALYSSARGIDRSPVHVSRERRSISQEQTFAQDIGDGATIHRALLRMSEGLASRLRSYHLVAQTIRLKLRTPDFATITRQVTLGQPTDQVQIIYREAHQLLYRNWAEGRLLRLLGVGVSGLLDESGYQLRLFDRSDQRHIRLNQALDDIRDRYGVEAIVRASLLRRHRHEDGEGRDES